MSEKEVASRPARCASNFPARSTTPPLKATPRQDIFLDDEDRQRFLGVLAHVVSRFHLRLHAYCLMDNHFIWWRKRPRQICRKPRASSMDVYTQAFNRRHGRVGHVLQGRFKAIVVDRNSYLPELWLYVAEGIAHHSP